MKRPSAADRRRMAEQDAAIIEEGLRQARAQPDAPQAPAPAYLQLHVGDPGVLEERIVYSSRDAERPYRMIRTPSGWQHADEGCEDWLFRPLKQQAEPCQHVRDLNKEITIHE